MAAAKDNTKSNSTKRKSFDKNNKSSNNNNGSNKKHKSSHDKNNNKNNNKTNNNDSNLSNSAMKRQARKDRQAQRRHADIVAEAKSLWNKIRIKSNTPQEITSLMEQIMTLIRGKVNEIALQHDASRVVQAAIQFGTDEQRMELLKEITTSTNNTQVASSSKDKDGKDNNSSNSALVELSKIQYAHFCCLKFIKYCARNPDAVKIIVKSFKGSMPKLAVHSVAARVIEALFINFPPSATIPLKQEFYGPHFALFAATATALSSGGKKKQDPEAAAAAAPTLQSVIASAKTETQKTSAISFVKDNIITKGITKSFFSYKYFQDLLAEYMTVLVTPSTTGGGGGETENSNEIRTNLAPSLVDHSIHLLSTRSGTKVVALCAAYGTPKDRKRICKSLKGYTKSSLLHRDAYVAILRLIQVTDDTVSIHKSILNEILTTGNNNDKSGDTNNTEMVDSSSSSSSPLLEIALSATASKLFLMLLVDDDDKRNKYFDPYEQSILCTDAYFMENGKKVPTSKKDAVLRRKELLQHMNTELVNLCINHADELVMSLPGSRLIKEFYDHYKNNNNNNDDESCKENCQKVVDAVIDVCEAALEVSSSSMSDDNDDNDDDEEEAEGDEEGKEKNKSFPLFEDPTGHRTIKNIILCDVGSDKEKEAKKSKSAMFSISFVERLGDRLLEVAKSNRGAFVVASLLKVSQVRKQVQEKLKAHEKELKKLSKGKGVTSGYAALLSELSS